MKKMRFVPGLKIWSAIFFAMVAVSAAAFAEDAKPASAALSVDDLKKALGMSIYLQAGYAYNGNASAGNINDLRVFDQKANSFILDLAEISFVKDPAAGSIGYKVKVAAGEMVKYIHAAGMGAPTDSFDVIDAYVSYLAPVGKGLRFDMGKMSTYFGAETLEAIDSPNYSRSFLLTYALPATHTGVKASYAITDALNASFYVVNGWDNAVDNNRDKSYGLGIGYAPAEIVSGYLNVMTGPEQANDTSKRTLYDLIATIKPTKKLSFILNGDVASETYGDPTTGGTAKWSGAAGIVKCDFNDTYSLSVRGEFFNDTNGARTGTARKLSEVTVTPEIRLSGGMVLRPEYRHDISDQRSFDNNTKKSQDTIALGAMYRW